MAREKRKRFYVLTGGPCSGKSTLLAELKKRGFGVLEEIARKVIRERNGAELSKDELKFRQEEIFRRQYEQEENALSQGKHEEYFLDRGMIDGAGYSMHFLGFVPGMLKMVNLEKRYDGVFELELLPFKKDKIRVEKNFQQAQKVHNLVMSAYKNEGYKPIFVKKENIYRRRDFLIEYVRRLQNESAY